MINSQVKANLLMLIVTTFWGSSYLFMKIGLAVFDEFNLIALRFGLAFILAGIFYFRRLIHSDCKTIKYGFFLGTILFLAFASLHFGLKSTSTSKAGFLVGLTVLFVPLLSSVFMKKLPEKRILLGVSLALTGIALLTLNHLSAINTGDFLCILCALFYALHIIATGKLTKDVDSITLGVLQLGFTGAWGLVFSLFLEAPKLPGTPKAWIAVLGLGILCSAVGFIGQTAAQKYTTATHMSLIFSLEPVFAALFAFLFLGEILSPKGYIGALLVMFGVLTSQIDFKGLPLKKTKQAEGMNYHTSQNK